LNAAKVKKNSFPLLAPKVLRGRQMALLLSVTIGIATTLPYWIIKGNRFIYYSALETFFVGLAVVISCSFGRKRIFALPILLLIAGNALASTYYVTHWNWLDFNSSFTRSMSEALLSKPGFKECSPTKPCCLHWPSRGWGQNEWVLNWNAGAFPNMAYIPAEWWPDADRCVRQLNVD
jgi:hypothetical protein